MYILLKASKVAFFLKGKVKEEIVYGINSFEHFKVAFGVSPSGIYVAFPDPNSKTKYHVSENYKVIHKKVAKLFNAKIIYFVSPESDVYIKLNKNAFLNEDFILDIEDYIINYKEQKKVMEIE